MASIRGNCRACYAKNRRAVVGGKTTWELLEACGLVLPPSQKAALAHGRFMAGMMASRRKG